MTENITEGEAPRYPIAEELAADPRLSPDLPILDAGISEEEAVKLGLTQQLDYSAQIASQADEAQQVNPMQIMQQLQFPLETCLENLILAHDEYAKGVNQVYNRHVVLDEVEHITKMHKHDFGFHSGKMIEQLKMLQAHLAHIGKFNFPWLEPILPEVPAE